MWKSTGNLWRERGELITDLRQNKINLLFREMTITDLTWWREHVGIVNHHSAWFHSHFAWLTVYWHFRQSGAFLHTTTPGKCIKTTLKYPEGFLTLAHYLYALEQFCRTVPWCFSAPKIIFRKFWENLKKNNNKKNLLAFKIKHSRVNWILNANDLQTDMQNLAIKLD